MSSANQRSTKELTGTRGVPVIEAFTRVADLRPDDGMLLTSSVRGIVPAGSVDGHELRVDEALLELLRALVGDAEAASAAAFRSAYLLAAARRSPRDRQRSPGLLSVPVYPCYADPVNGGGGGVVANLTVAIEDDVLKKARQRAVEQGASVNAVLREFLREYTGKTARQADAGRRLIELAHDNATVVGPIAWTREDLYDRPRR